MKIKVMRWPAPYRFAFGITDDPDQSTVERVRIIYDLCYELGIQPSRGSWVTYPKRNCGLVNQSLPDNGVTLDDQDYLDLCKQLQSQGIEMTIHGVSSGNNKRQEVINGLESFESKLGTKPQTILFHAHNAENMYWGAEFTRNALAKLVVSVLVPSKTEKYEGHQDGSEYFCGDVTLNKFKYTRLFRTRSLNVLSKNPNMPYHINGKPLVRLWFSGTAQDLDACRRINPQALDQVAKQDGLILLYAHLAEKFLNEDNTINPIARQALEHISHRDDCWNAGVTEILDRCLATKNLIVNKRRNAIVLSNPSSADLPGLQFKSKEPAFYFACGTPLSRTDDGVFTVPNLPAQSTLSLFTSKAQAHINDPAGISQLETLRMQYEELKRTMYSRKHNNYFTKTSFTQEELDEINGPKADQSDDQNAAKNKT